MTSTGTVYNTTDGPLIVDRAGRVLPARERSPEPVDLSASPVAGHIAAERLIVVDDEGAKPPKSPKRTGSNAGASTEES